MCNKVAQFPMLVENTHLSWSQRHIRMHDIENKTKNWHFTQNRTFNQNDNLLTHAVSKIAICRSKRLRCVQKQETNINSWVRDCVGIILHIFFKDWFGLNQFFDCWYDDWSYPLKLYYRFTMANKWNAYNKRGERSMKKKSIHKFEHWIVCSP